MEPQESAPPRDEIRELLRRAGRLLADAQALRHEHERARDAVHAALTVLRRQQARTELAAIPLARLRDVTGGRLRLGTLEKAGYATVLSVLDATPYELQRLPGVGPQTQAQAHAAARQIARAAEEAATVHIDVERQDSETTTLLVALHPLVEAGPELPRACRTGWAVEERLGTLIPAARAAASWWRGLLSGRQRRQEAARAATELDALLAGEAETRLLIAQATTDLLRPPPDPMAAWIDFELRAADYYNLLAEIAAVEPRDRVAAEGFLPDELSGRVRAQELDDTCRRVSLRGYQAFGARFALAQGRVILGDEMGLGKTIQAIAALAHLAARGSTHFLVICPASVLVNWVREVESRSTLRAYRLHGAERDMARAEWHERGGVAVTTFDGLRRLDTAPPLGMLVVDEAHYVKNRETLRSKAVAGWCARVERVLFMTGTPMENRVEEFRELVAYLQPGRLDTVAGSDTAAGAQAFRRAVAPVYLRRNQQDVLTELPDLVHVDEWEEFSAADADAYRRVVAEGRFMAMRRAAYAVPEKSAKLERLCELVAEAADNGLKVVVFSYFRDVLATVEQALGPRVFGPISGSVPPERRQQMVDAFTDAPGHAVLLAQIQAGGVGLNLQAASVVIICEPQVKPTTESQAVARAHRMGQVRRVQVHRLLSPDSVDERMLRILQAKSALFDAYARRSDLAESTPDAIDVSEQALARQIVEEEQQRLAVGEGAAGAQRPVDRRPG
ncbi:DEAD/DEAH box helicase [Nonomuraea sp. LPB2021202275-12-8]|uniref:DEAD/DEAH box helicase n=1 Tax=Nonomuraea sp. LPB2021202275-12-8 TaxID=3120159 RepID=UPI00300D7F14